MPQETDLNVSPYYDDFSINNNYYKVLFKPGYPVQARELTTLQSILQNQIEQFGNHTFKDGSVVIPGNLIYKNDLDAVLIQNTYQGLPSNFYLDNLKGVRIRGEISGVTAVISDFLNPGDAPGVENTTLYVKYLASDSENAGDILFYDGENLLIDENISFSDPSIEDENDNTQIQLVVGEGFATTISDNCTRVGSSVYLEEGIYFIRGYFVNVQTSILYISPYTDTVSCKVGFRVIESIVNSFDDEDLNDNSQGFSNYAAPGADRFSIFLKLEAIPLDSTDTNNFIQLLEIRDGLLINIRNKSEYNIIAQEFARRTYDESGDYYIKPPLVTAQETLNDLKGNNGIFNEKQLTYNGNIPSEDLGTYNISPLKAYVKGFEIETISPTFLDFEKPRTTKTLEDQSINYFTGPAFTLNRVYGSPVVSIATTYYVSLRDSRVGNSRVTAPGQEIGLARVYDFALESGSYITSNPDENQWDISLYDIQTYTNITLNEPISLSIPVHVKGKESGATAYLRESVSSASSITVYDIKGRFSLGEKLIFNGIENNRVTDAIKSYGVGDVKSIFGNVGTSYTFSGDVIQSVLKTIGQVNISPISTGGISTVTLSGSTFVGVATVGNLVSFSNPGLTTTTIAKILSVSNSSLTISGVTTVIGVCEGKLPSTSINPSDFSILTSNLQRSTDNTLYTELPKENVSSVELENSQLTIRKQIDVTIQNGGTGIINADLNETFLPFDEERYVLISENGQTESLTEDKFTFSSGSKVLEINGLSSSGNAKLIATLRKTNVKSKIKNRNKIKTIIINKSKLSASGIGATTLNDGLTYGNYPYGARVQDQEICLLEPDVTRVYGVFESNDENDPDLPSIIFSGLNGPNKKTQDLILGEEFIGETSQSLGVCVEKINDFKISYIDVNSNNFINGEKVTFKESGVTGFISLLDAGDSDVSLNYSFDNGQRETIYDYSKLVRYSDKKEPTRKLKVVYEYASFSASDTGDLTTADSYLQYDYCDIEDINGIRNSDILDIRPRVSSINVTENSRSPFEFLSRSFTSSGNSASNILASDESILLSYSFYLPRIDTILLDRNGYFQVNYGIAAENPQPPIYNNDSLEVASVYLPPYLCNAKDVTIELKEYKRYRMSDIGRLENRIENLEYYTSLSLLEVETSNMSVLDENGIDRFKSGIFVDDFSGTLNQEKVTIVKNSIDKKNSELRPTHYTTSIDLLLGTNSLVGIGTSVNPLADARTDTNLIGTGVRRTGQVISLDYQEVSYISQPFSSRVVNASPYAQDFYAGNIQLFPSSDLWVDQVIINDDGNVEINTIFLPSDNQRIAGGADPQVGFNPTLWDSHTTTWTGVKENVDIKAPSPAVKWADRTDNNATENKKKIKDKQSRVRPQNLARNKKGMVNKIVGNKVSGESSTRSKQFTNKIVGGKKRNR